MLLVVGLGNPGTRYADTRHNAGFMVVDELLSRGRALFREKFEARFAQVELAGETVLLLQPQTFMNLSGHSVQAAAAFYKVPTERVLVVHDELDVPFGQLRLKSGGGDGGHNGLKSITAQLAGPGYARLRFGIGRPPAGFRGDIADFVLHPFPLEAREELRTLVVAAADAVELCIKRGFADAMNRINQRPKAPKVPSPVLPSAPPAGQAVASPSAPSAGQAVLSPSSVRSDKPSEK